MLSAKSDVERGEGRGGNSTYFFSTMQLAGLPLWLHSSSPVLEGSCLAGSIRRPERLWLKTGLSASFLLTQLILRNLLKVFCHFHRSFKWLICVPMETHLCYSQKVLWCYDLLCYNTSCFKFPQWASQHTFIYLFNPLIFHIRVHQHGNTEIRLYTTLDLADELKQWLYSPKYKEKKFISPPNYPANGKLIFNKSSNRQSGWGPLTIYANG